VCGEQLLDVAFNMLSALPPSLKYLGNLTELDCRSNELSTIPAELAKCVHMKRILLYKNNISSLPDIFSGMKQLETFDVSCNELRTIPPSIFSLTLSLAVLDLENNLLTEIPASIGNLRNLKKVCFAKNKISKIPVELGSLLKLQELDVSSNSISELPSAVFSRLLELCECYLQKNQIKVLPSSFGDLKKLEVLDIRKNPLEIIAPEVGSLTVLEEIRVDVEPGSTLRQPPRDVCNKGRDRIFAYLKDLAESTPLPENCYAEGLGIAGAASVQEKLSFTVVAVDKHKKLKTAGGDTFAVNVELMDQVFEEGSTIVSQPAKSTITDLQNGTYLVEYSASKQGFYSIRVRFNQKHIQGSPFRVAVAHAAFDPTTCVFAPPSREEGAEVGVEHKLPLHCFDGLGNRLGDFDGIFDVTVQNPGDKLGYPSPAALKIIQDKNTITCLTTASGRYTLEVSYKGTPIKDSPFELSVRPTATHAPNCLVTTPTFQKTETGTLTSFVIEARDKYQNLRVDGGDTFTATLTHPTQLEV